MASRSPARRAPRPTESGAGKGWGKTAATLVVMWIAVVAVYFPVPSTPQDNSLGGIDYEQLHARRIRYAQEGLASGSLPAWYSHELLGSPFWSNTQNFPFIPTRLLVLAFDPLHV